MEARAHDDNGMVGGVFDGALMVSQCRWSRLLLHAVVAVAGEIADSYPVGRRS